MQTDELRDRYNADLLTWDELFESHADLERELNSQKKEHDKIKALLKEWMEHDLQDSRALEIVDEVKKWCINERADAMPNKLISQEEFP